MQSQLRTTFVVLILASLSAARVEAACTLNIAPATKLKVSLVRAYTECTAATTYTPGGFPACVAADQLDASCNASNDKCSSNADCLPSLCDDNFYNGCLGPQDCVSGSACVPVPVANTCVAPASDPPPYKFGPKGSCTLSAKSKVEKDCALLTDSSGGLLGLSPGPCHVTYASLKCKDIQRLNGTPASELDGGWSLDMRVRVTVDDGGGLTQMDLPFSLWASSPDKGSFSLRANSAEVLAIYLAIPSGAGLPECTQLQFTDVWLKDPGGNLFATVGMATIAP